jgi:predicted alpha/beta hydrolase family esterase
MPGSVRSNTRQVLFVQGGGRDAHDAWDNKLVASLQRALGPGYTVRYPRMPDESDPHAAAGKKTIARALGALNDGVFLVGHSIGAAILIDFLADATTNRKLAGVFLVSTPFIGDGGWPSEELRSTKEAAAILGDGAPLYVYRGSDDETVPVSHLKLLAAAFPQATIRRLDGRDHQLNEDLSEVAHDISSVARAVPSHGPPRTKATKPSRSRPVPSGGRPSRSGGKPKRLTQ